MTIDDKQDALDTIEFLEDKKKKFGESVLSKQMLRDARKKLEELEDKPNKQPEGQKPADKPNPETVKKTVDATKEAAKQVVSPPAKAEDPAEIARKIIAAKTAYDTAKKERKIEELVSACIQLILFNQGNEKELKSLKQQFAKDIEELINQKTAQPDKKGDDSQKAQAGGEKSEPPKTEEKEKKPGLWARFTAKLKALFDVDALWNKIKQFFYNLLVKKAAPPAEEKK